MSDGIIMWALRVFLIVMGIIIIYQLLRKLLGGSWMLELILALVITNLTYSFYQKGWSKQFEKKFEALARDFKEHIKHK